MKGLMAIAVSLLLVACGTMTAKTASTEGRSTTGEPCRPPPSFGYDSPVPSGTAVSATSQSTAADPTVTDGDKYHVVLENDRVRVLRYQDKPGDKTHPHHHAEFVLYALSPFRRRLTFPDGTVKERDFKAGDVIWMPEQVHTGENTGSTNTDVVIFEQKRH